jgi:hypothetical protein
MRWVELKGGEYCEEGLVVAQVILNRMTYDVAGTTLKLERVFSTNLFKLDSRSWLRFWKNSL